MTVGENIKKYRIDAGLTQRKLAEKINCAIGTIQQYEGGKREPRFEQLQKIANALNVHMIDLMETYEQHILKKDIINYFSGRIDSSMININQNNVVDVSNLLDKPKEQDNLLTSFNKLNTQGRRKAIERVEELTEIPRYTDPDEPQEEDPADQETE